MGRGLEPGIVLGDRYRLRRLLGEGGMGWVWEATDATTEKSVALKLLKSDKDDDRKRFQRELRAAAAIRHPNVIAVHDFIELPDGTLVIVMDLLEGETLAALLGRDRRIALGELVAVLLPVLAALEAAHAVGIVHRDVKPDNIYLCTTDSGVHVKVLDFGIAKLTSEDGLAARTQALTGTGSMVGTPYYMSPEQVFADKDLDCRADIWSLGIVMYECLTGLRPTEGDTVGRVLKRIMAAEFEPITVHCADLPEEIAALVKRMLSADREDRPRALSEVRVVLERHTGTARRPASAAELATTAASSADEGVARIDTNRGVSIAPPSRSRARTRPVAAGAFAAIALIGGAAYLRGWDDVEPQAPRQPASASAYVANDPPPSASPAPASSPSPSASVSAVIVAKEPAPPTSSAASVASAISAASAASVPSAPSAKPATPLVSKPSCEKGEVLSEGHCCPRGHLWRGGRCERPIATSF